MFDLNCNYSYLQFLILVFDSFKLWQYNLSLYQKKNLTEILTS